MKEWAKIHRQGSVLKDAGLAHSARHSVMCFVLPHLEENIKGPIKQRLEFT